MQKGRTGNSIFSILTFLLPKSQVKGRQKKLLKWILSSNRLYFKSNLNRYLSFKSPKKHLHCHVNLCLSHHAMKSSPTLCTQCKNTTGEGKHSAGFLTWTQRNGRAHLCSLLNDAVPHLVGQQHVLLYQVLLHTLVCLCPNHVSNCFIKCVHLRGQPHHKQQGQKGLRESSALPDMFELCTGSHQPWSIFFQVPDALCLKFLCIHCAGGHCSFLWKHWVLHFPFLDCSSLPPSQIQEL